MAKPPRRLSKNELARGRPSALARAAGEAPKSEEQTVLAGRYRLEEIIGRGGMGEVWSAYDATLGRRAAVKMVQIGGEGLDDTEARFALEVSLSKQLRGPAFVEVFAHGHASHRGSPCAYLVMELLEGETLEQRLKRKRTLDIEEAREFLNGIGVALRLAHALQVVHRDLKPANIFFAKLKPNASGARPLDGRSEIMKLLDFGIAKDAWCDSRLTKPGVLLGSAHYMSPEQIRSGSDVDSRSDLWSLGVLLFRALTGARPFDGSAAVALGAIVEGPTPKASQFAPALPRGLDAFFVKAFQKSPGDRFQTVDEMIEAFAEIHESKNREASRYSIDIDFDDAIADARPTVLDGAARADAPVPNPERDVSFSDVLSVMGSSQFPARPSLLQDGRPTVLESDVSQKQTVALPTSTSVPPSRAQQDSDARQALLPLAMPAPPLPLPRLDPPLGKGGWVVGKNLQKQVRTRWSSTIVLLCVFVLLTVAIAVAWRAGSTGARLF